MRIAFADYCHWDFHVASVETIPLGGAHSAACYLARELAQRGHEVFLLSGTKEPGIHAGVTCLSLPQMNWANIQALHLDAYICLPGPDAGIALRHNLPASTRLILWTQHSFDQPSVQNLALPELRACFDGFAFVSEWQSAEFRRTFQIPSDRIGLLRNAAPPVFLDLSRDEMNTLLTKPRPPILAYTSTPFRGLDLLLEAFPAIRAAIPGTRLRVYSSMQVYQTAPVMDHLEYGGLYQRCRAIEGVEYIGSIPQPQLAREMRHITALSYPNIFAETSCIGVLEAMAAGCAIVTSDLGALPETTAGFARLVSVQQDRPSYLRDFTAQCVAALEALLRQAPEAVNRLLQQIEYVREHANWPQRAIEWERWLQTIIAQSRQESSPG